MPVTARSWSNSLGRGDFLVDTSRCQAPAAQPAACLLAPPLPVEQVRPARPPGGWGEAAWLMLPVLLLGALREHLVAIEHWLYGFAPLALPAETQWPSRSTSSTSRTKRASPRG
jgi:hypothetical protein